MAALRRCYHRAGLCTPWPGRRRDGRSDPGGVGSRPHRNVGQQALELDFFAQALRHVYVATLPTQDAK
jgi:hypothetical protein